MVAVLTSRDAKSMINLWEAHAFPNLALPGENVL